MNTKRCCVSTCKGERFDLAHRFPRDDEATSAWLKAIDNPDLFVISLKKLCENYQVCARHFRVSDYKHPQSRSLNKTAVPSLNLKDLSQLHLARDSTPCQIKDSKPVVFPQKLIEDPLITLNNTSSNLEDVDMDEDIYDDNEIECVEIYPIEEIKQIPLPKKQSFPLKKCTKLIAEYKPPVKKHSPGVVKHSPKIQQHSPGPTVEKPRPIVVKTNPPMRKCHLIVERLFPFVKETSPLLQKHNPEVKKLSPSASVKKSSLRLQKRKIPLEILKPTEENHSSPVTNNDGKKSLEIPNHKPQEEHELTFTNENPSTFFEVSHPKYEQKLFLNSFWLRCHCGCLDCYDQENKRKKINPMDISRSVHPKNIEEIADKEILLINWDDGHTSTHNIDFLFKSQVPKKRKFLNRSHFNSNTLKIPPQVDFSKLVTVHKKIEMIFENLILHGFLILTQIPRQNTSMAKLAIERLFPHLETINFEPFSEIHSDISTNVTCANIDCGLKCFFVTKKTEILLTDGLHVAEFLKKSDANAFKILSQTKVPLNIQDSNVHHKQSSPIIEVDPETNEISKIKLDVHVLGLLDTLPHVKVESFYDSLRQFMTAVRSNENKMSLALLPGTMIILDNWRVLHKLSDQAGVFQCYLERKDYIGRSSCLGLL